jgi:iron(III) transport system substrate-binding protein
MRWFLLLLCLLHSGCSNSQKVTLYCAQDQEFAESLLAQFSTQTKLEVASKFDTEANKSVSLYQEILSEANRPRCDVFWNNEILSTIRLQKKGLLEAYESPQAKDYPSYTKSSDHTWQAFAARARILIVNTNLVSEKDRPESIWDLVTPEWKDRLVMAKPQFGTTATHAACLFEVLGNEVAKEWYRGLKANKIHIVAGNKQVAEQVAAGRFAVGFTDQDDAIGEIDAGKPVIMIFPDREGHSKYPRIGTLFIPNSIAISKGSPHPQYAKQLVNYLLSPESEKKLAEGGGFQIPLNPKVECQFHPSLKEIRMIRHLEVDWEKAAELWDEVQTFLVEEFAR